MNLPFKRRTALYPPGAHHHGYPGTDALAIPVQSVKKSKQETLKIKGVAGWFNFCLL